MYAALLAFPCERTSTEYARHTMPQSKGKGQSSLWEMVKVYYGKRSKFTMGKGKIYYGKRSRLTLWERGQNYCGKGLLLLIK